MTKHEWIFVLVIIGGILGAVGMGGYFFVEARKVSVEQKRVQEEEKTKRTEERWKFLPNLRKDKDDE